MTTTVAQMSQDELREMIETSVERKLLELLGDPDEGLVLKKSVRTRLLRQQKALTPNERGRSLQDVASQLGLD